MSSCPDFASGPLSYGAPHPTVPHLMHFNYTSSSLASALDDPMWATHRTSSNFIPSSPSAPHNLPPTSAHYSYSLPTYSGTTAGFISPTSTSSPSSDGTQDLPYDVYHDPQSYQQLSASTQHHHAPPHTSLESAYIYPQGSSSHDMHFAWTAAPFKRRDSVPEPGNYEYSLGPSSDLIGGAIGHGHSASTVSHDFPSQAVIPPNSPVHVKLESPTLATVHVTLHHNYEAYESYADCVSRIPYDGVPGNQAMQPIRTPMLYYNQHGVYQQQSVKYEAPIVASAQSQEVAVCDPRALAGVDVAEVAVSDLTGEGCGDDELGDDDAEGEWEEPPPSSVQVTVPAETIDENESEQEVESADEGSLYDDEGSEYEDSRDGDYGSRKRKRSAPRKTPVRKRSTSSPASTIDGADFAIACVDESFFAPLVTGGRQLRLPKAAPSTLPLPVPVPNLTKKSRGRRVPTVSALVVKGGVAKNSRAYACKVPGCGKCFARGEHLKRHVRSIHTNEKPHICPHSGCEKAFSRHDNLRQHMRVHTDYSSKRQE